MLKTAKKLALGVGICTNTKVDRLSCKVSVDGYTDFIFVNRYGETQDYGTLNNAIHRIIRDCNNTQFEKSENPKVLLPHFSCHTLRHTFTTRMCGVGVSIKVIQDSLGHSYVSTMLDIYSHISDTMQRQAAVHIDRNIGGTDAQMPTAQPSARKDTAPIEFTPYKPKIRKPGTCCVTMINDHLYEGRFSPRVNGKRIARNIYAKTREECEEKLAEMIAEVKAQIKAEKEKMTG